jgi:hypothetical protein
MSAVSTNPFEKIAATSRRVSECAISRNAKHAMCKTQLICKSRRTYASFGHRGAAGCKNYRVDVEALRAKLGNPPEDDQVVVLVD